MALRRPNYQSISEPDKQHRAETVLPGLYNLIAGSRPVITPYGFSKLFLFAAFVYFGVSLAKRFDPLGFD